MKSNEPNDYWNRLSRACCGVCFAETANQIEDKRVSIRWCVDGGYESCSRNRNCCFL